MSAVAELERPVGPRELWDYVDVTGSRTLVVAASKDPNAKVSLLLVSPVTGEPELAVKAPTTEGAAAAVERERRALVDLARLDLGDVGETIPRVVDTLDFDGRIALVTTAVRGRPMSTAYLAWRHTARHSSVAADFAAAGAWLTRFQNRTTTAVPAPEPGIAQSLLARFGEDVGIEADVEELAALEQRADAERVSATAIHGDFWFGNVLTTAGRVSGVVDWEAGSVIGNPVRDLVRFANMYALYLDRANGRRLRVRGQRGLRTGEFGAGLEFALAGNGWFPALFREFVAGGLERVGASRDSWRAAVLVGVAEVAASTDDTTFARHHLELFRRLTVRGRAL
jgi:aminoglycoside phosphotransferase (APT) family kinase protein